jgi:predicted esterase
MRHLAKPNLILMKKIYLVMLFALMYISAKAQDYIATGDSCFKAKDYICAAKNYDLFLEKIESHSNQIAYRSARSWSLAGNKDRAIAAVKKYVANNYENNYMVFSDRLLNEPAFDLIKDDARWKEIIAAVIAQELAIKQAEKRKLDSITTFQSILEKEGMLNKLKLDNNSALTIYNNIKTYNEYPAIKQELISMQFKLTDSLRTSFLMVLPPDYDARKKYPLMFFLHGGVMVNTGYPDYISAKTTTGWNRYYTKYAKLNKVIMVYPAGNKDYNWMYADKGFFMIPAILKQIKEVVNIDDNRVFISGHSNGATGSFSYAIKQPTPFAGFSGFNTRPRVATGGTYIKNILNRSFFNVSVDLDYYYPPEAHDSLNKVMKDIYADYKDNRYNGFPHSFPQFDESEPAYKLLFNDLDNRKRDPFHSTVNWECDDVKYGRCDWISITALDTTAAKAAWQTQINFRINKWIVLDKKNKLQVRDTLTNGFNYKKSSGAIKASYSGNVFKVETSDVRSIRLYISPEMVNISNPITIVVNGKQYFKGKLTYDKAFMIDEFEKTLDKAAIWVNHIDIDLSNPSKL